jgi:chromosome segregation ATPase
LYKQQVEVLRAQDSKQRQTIAKLRDENRKVTVQFNELRVELAQLGSQSSHVGDHIQQLQEENSRCIQKSVRLETELEEKTRDSQRLSVQVRDLDEHAQRQSAQARKYRSQLEELSLRVESEASVLRQNVTDAGQREAQYLERISVLERRCTEAEQKAHVASREMKSNHDDYDKIIHKMEDFEKIVSDYKQNEAEYMQRETESHMQLEQSLLQRDQALADQARIQSEADRLRQRMEEYEGKVQYEAKYRAENMLREHKQREAKFLDENRNLLATCAQLELQAQRAMQEKSSAEHALHQLEAHFTSESRELQAELGAARAELKDSLAEQHMLKDSADRAITELKNREHAWQQQKETLQAQVADVRQHLSDSQRTLNERDTQVHTMNEELKKMHASVDAARKLRAEEVTTLRERLERTTADKDAMIFELETQLDHAQQVHNNAQERATHLLQEQDKMASKWRAESQASVRQFQLIIETLKQECATLSSSNGRLAGEANNLKRRCDKLVIHGEKLEVSNANLSEQCNAVSAHLSDALRNIENAKVLEADLRERLSSVQSQSDRLEVEKQRMKRDFEAALRQIEYKQARSLGNSHASISALRSHQMGPHSVDTSLYMDLGDDGSRGDSDIGIGVGVGGSVSAEKYPAPPSPDATPQRLPAVSRTTAPVSGLARQLDMDEHDTSDGSGFE